MSPTKIFRTLSLIAFLAVGPNAHAIDTSIANLEVSGNVPTVFSVTARGLPGDLDLTPGVIVNDRLIGILHFKYNQNVDSITIATDTASGVPENGAATAYPFGTAFTATVAGCSSLTGVTNVALTQAGVDYNSVASGALTDGVIEDCNLTASWGGTAAVLPLAGVYSMNISITMVSL